MKNGLFTVFTGCIVGLLTGCAGTQSDFTPPLYQPQTSSQAAQTYSLHQAINQTPTVQPTTTPAAPAQAAPQTSSPPPTVQPAPAALATTTAAQPAGPAQPEVIPPSPGPDYVWMPSYWTIGLGGNWVWVGGHYVLRRGVPEEQLRAARGMLEQARAALAGKPLKNTDRAIDQINDALRDYRND